MTAMRPKLITREIIPFTLSFAALALAALLLDSLLHYYTLVWIGRYLGIVGTLMILGSFRYSLRKRKIISSGNPVTLLRRHEYLAWLGSLSAVFRLVVAFVLVCQAAFRKLCCSVDFGVLGLRWTSLIGLQLRAAPDQRLGFAWRAAA